MTIFGSYDDDGIMIEDPQWARRMRRQIKYALVSVGTALIVWLILVLVW